jgi:hypothetical protein
LSSHTQSFPQNDALSDLALTLIFNITRTIAPEHVRRGGDLPRDGLLQAADFQYRHAQPMLIEPWTLKVAGAALGVGSTVIAAILLYRRESALAKTEADLRKIDGWLAGCRAEFHRSDVILHLGLIQDLVVKNSVIASPEVKQHWSSVLVQCMFVSGQAGLSAMMKDELPKAEYDKLVRLRDDALANPADGIPRLGQYLTDLPIAVAAHQSHLIDERTGKLLTVIQTKKTISRLRAYAVTLQMVSLVLLLLAEVPAPKEHVRNSEQSQTTLIRPSKRAPIDAAAESRPSPD